MPNSIQPYFEIAVRSLTRKDLSWQLKIIIIFNL
jgi:hypothetical protein